MTDGVSEALNVMSGLCLCIVMLMETLMDKFSASDDDESCYSIDMDVAYLVTPEALE